jgi:hypothetical protein
MVEAMRKDTLKKWWCVVTSCDNRGRVVANIVDTKEAVTQPESKYRETARKDVYIDWYGSEKEAKEAVENAKKA